MPTVDVHADSNADSLSVPTVCTSPNFDPVLPCAIFGGQRWGNLFIWGAMAILADSNGSKAPQKHRFVP